MKNKASVILAVIALLSGSLFTVYYFTQSTRAALLEQVDSALDRNDTGLAITLLSVYVQQYPDDVEKTLQLDGLQTEYRNRFISAARKYRDQGKNQLAVKAYNGHLGKNPGDYSATLELAELYRELAVYEAAENLLRPLVANSSTGPELNKKAREMLNLVINTWANGLKREADNAVPAANFNDAIKLYTRVIELRARNPSLQTETMDWGVAVRAFDDVVARRAFAVWLATGLEQAKSVLVTEYDAGIFKTADLYELNRQEQLQQRRDLLFQQIWQHGDRLFGQRRWQSAHETYEQAKQLRGENKADDFDGAVAAMQFNQVLCQIELNNGKLARQLYGEIKGQAPWYEPVKMRALGERLYDRSDSTD